MACGESRRRTSHQDQGSQAETVSKERKTLQNRLKVHWESATRRTLGERTREGREREIGTVC